MSDTAEVVADQTALTLVLERWRVSQSLEDRTDLLAAVLHNPWTRQALLAWKAASNSIWQDLRTSHSPEECIRRVDELVGTLTNIRARVQDQDSFDHYMAMTEALFQECLFSKEFSYIDLRSRMNAIDNSDNAAGAWDALAKTEANLISALVETEELVSQFVEPIPEGLSVTNMDRLRWSAEIFQNTRTLEVTSPFASGNATLQEACTIGQQIALCRSAHYFAIPSSEAIHTLSACINSMRPGVLEEFVVKSVLTLLPRIAAADDAAFMTPWMQLLAEFVDRWLLMGTVTQVDMTEMAIVTSACGFLLTILEGEVVRDFIAMIRKLKDAIEGTASFLIAHGLFHGYKQGIVMLGDLPPKDPRVEPAMSVVKHVMIRDAIRLLIRRFTPQVSSSDAKWKPGTNPVLSFDFYQSGSNYLFCSYVAPFLEQLGREQNRFVHNASSYLIGAIGLEWSGLQILAEATAQESGQSSGVVSDNILRNGGIPLAKFARVGPAAAEAKKWMTLVSGRENEFFERVQRSQLDQIREFSDRPLSNSLVCALLSSLLCALGRIRAYFVSTYYPLTDMKLTSSRETLDTLHALQALSQAILRISTGCTLLLSQEFQQMIATPGTPDWLLNDIIYPGTLILPELWSLHAQLMRDIGRRLGNEPENAKLINEFAEPVLLGLNEAGDILSYSGELWNAIASLLQARNPEVYLDSIRTALSASFEAILNLQNCLSKASNPHAIQALANLTVLAYFRLFRVFSTKNSAATVAAIKNAILPPFRLAFVRYVKAFSEVERAVTSTTEQ